MKSLINILFFITPAVLFGQENVKEYFLSINDTTLNFTGKDRPAIAVNGSIPAPTLYFTEGDKAVIHVKNEMKDKETSIHWHGLLLPNIQDGVPYLTTPPIKAGESRTFEFPIIHAGTYWYHSHTNLQEQSGVYGAIVIQPKTPPIYEVDKELVVMLSDWTNENPDAIVKALRRGLEYYAIQKKQPPSWNKIIANKGVKKRIKGSFKRMPLMDISDLYYNAFLINGKPKQQLLNFKSGEKVRLRIINGGAGTYFNLQYAGGKMTVVAADGIDVKPIEVDRLLLSIAETYDVIITIPNDSMAYELRATSQDGSGFSSMMLGQGMEVNAPTIPRPNIYNMSMMDMMMSGPNGVKSGVTMKMDNTKHDKMKMDDTKHDKMKMDNTKHDKMKMDNTITTLKYDMLSSIQPTTLPKENKWREVRMELNGNMWRYIWSINGKTLSEADKIKIKKGENVRFELVNKTMMNHPMHLHGHFFRVLNGQGDYSPLKHTVNVPPMGTVIIEFEANEEKDWFFHCHILYHAKTGMARVISYEGDTVATELAKARKEGKEKSDKNFLFWGTATAMSNFSELSLTLSNTRNQFNLDADGDWNGNFETDVDYERYFGANGYFRAFAGATVEGQQVPVVVDGMPTGSMIENVEVRPVVGVRYLLPFFINSELRIDNQAKVRLQLDGETLLLPRLSFEWLYNTNNEWRLGLNGIVSKNFSITANYDNRYGWGGGLSVRF